MGHATLDSVAEFGFIAGFCTLVLLGYRRQLHARLPVIAVGLACCGVYGFLQGAWPVGFVLVALTVSEFRLWWHGRHRIPAPVSHVKMDADQTDSESRIRRMFGPA